MAEFIKVMNKTTAGGSRDIISWNYARLYKENDNE